MLQTARTRDHPGPGGGRRLPAGAGRRSDGALRPDVGLLAAIAWLLYRVYREQQLTLALTDARKAGPSAQWRCSWSPATSRLDRVRLWIALMAGCVGIHLPDLASGDDLLAQSFQTQRRSVTIGGGDVRFMTDADLARHMWLRRRLILVQGAPRPRWSWSRCPGPGGLPGEPPRPWWRAGSCGPPQDAARAGARAKVGSDAESAARRTLPASCVETR
jgi:hypothetical protein